MPLDGSTAVRDLRDEMFEVRPPRTKTVHFEQFGRGVKVFEQPITRRQVMALVDLCRKHRRLMAQNAELVPLSRYFDREWVGFGVTGLSVYYFSPHGFIDYYIREALGHYRGCEKSLEDDALMHLRFIERQHRSIHRARRRVHEQEKEFALLLTAT